jgi:hypothetical protein
MQAPNKQRQNAIEVGPSDACAISLTNIGANEMQTAPKVSGANARD